MKDAGLKKKLVDPRYARGQKYKGVIDEIKELGVCPFCPKTFKWHTKPILKRYKNWLITQNFNPYKNTQHHLLIISETHKELISDLTAKDWKSISTLLKWAIKKYKITGGGITMRFGDSLLTGATVKHLHLHLIVPIVKKGKASPVTFPIG